MNAEVQQLKVYNKGKLCKINKDYNVINHQVRFLVPVIRRNIFIEWEIINKENNNA